MFEKLGYQVKSLKRTQFATLNLAGLRRGQYRHLEPEEVWQLKNLGNKNQRGKRSGKDA
jgi:23S rRNA pseudouridine2605 synthase